MSKDGLVYTIPLRKGVKFHNGKEMTSDDVVASLQRWMEMAPRGKAVAKEIKSAGGQGAERDRHHAEPPLCAAGGAPRAAERLRGDHGQGLDRHAAHPVRRHRPVHVQGAQARPVRAAGALRRLQRPQRAGERLRRQARSAARRVALHPRSQREHARRRIAVGPVPLRRPAAGRVVRAARKRGQREARADRAVRLPVPGAQHQAGAARQPSRCARRCRHR